MSERVVAVLLAPAPTATGPGELPVPVRSAMLEDVVDLVTETPLVTAALAAPPGSLEPARAAAWPGTLVVATGDDPDAASVLAAVYDAHPDAVAVAVTVSDAPDLPRLLLGKLFSAVAGERGADAAVCPAEPVGLVAVACRTPVPQWLRDAVVRVDDEDAVARLRDHAPAGRLAVVPGWHRIRSVGDLSRLDTGLEGWEATRAALGR